MYSSKLPLYLPGAIERPLRKRARGPGKLVTVVLVILGLGLFLTCLNIYELHKMKEEHANHYQPVIEGRSDRDSVRKPVVWVQGKKLESGYLKHVFAVFDRVGFVVGDSNSDWEVLWAHDYPFQTLSKELSNLKPYQKVNHFPGSGYITNKVSLATSKHPFIPTAFKIPEDKDKFLDFSKKNPEKMWVQKSNNHRGIKIQKVDGLDLGTAGSFVQEYVSKPFLIDGRKFDIGIYTVLTSIDPLRVYIVDGDALIRFCPQDYYPFESTNVNKYVVGDDYTPVWEMPSLKKIYESMSYTFKETLNTYLQQQGKDDKKLWTDLKKAIMEIYLEKESNLIQSLTKYKTSRNFFEMVRFDFVLDEDLNIFLMEVNMSPNLSSGHFAQNKRLYEHVVFNILGVVGLARKVPNSFLNSPQDEAEMRVSDQDIQVFGGLCASKTCGDHCMAEECKLCNQCLTVEQKVILKGAYLEHINRGTCNRVFPPSVSREQALKWNASRSSAEFKALNTKNKLMYLWFVGKCQQDPAWCS